MNIVSKAFHLFHSMDKNNTDSNPDKKKDKKKEDDITLQELLESKKQLFKTIDEAWTEHNTLRNRFLEQKLKEEGYEELKVPAPGDTGSHYLYQPVPGVSRKDFIREFNDEKQDPEEPEKPQYSVKDFEDIYSYRYFYVVSAFIEYLKRRGIKVLDISSYS